MNSSGDITKMRGAIPPGGIEPEHHVTRLRLVSLITVVAAVGGLTAEAVFSKLLGVDVPRTGAGHRWRSKKQSGAPARQALRLQG